MTEILKVLQAFWQKAGVPAYPKNNVPNDAQMPYIIYSYAAGDFAKRNLAHAVVYTRAQSSLKTLAEISDAIFSMIPAESGRTLLFEDGKGAVRLFRAEPFVQEYIQEEKDIKANYFAIEMATYTI